MKIFLIPGMGADTRVYNNIELADEYDVIPVDWIEPHETDTLITYAQKLIYQYNITPKSVVIGNSLGGMIAVEMAKIIPLHMVIQISSIKTISEAPAYFTFFRYLPIYKIIPGRLLTSLGFLIKPLFGKISDADVWLFHDMLKKTSPTFLKWSMGAALHWDNTFVLPNIYQIQGDKDQVFNYKRIKDATIIKGGTHIMIFERAKEVNRILKKLLKK